MIVGLIGKIGNGKTTVSEWFQNKYNYREYTFAGPLKEIALILGFTKVQLYGTQKDKMTVNKLWGISAREFLQKFGTDVCRDILPTIFPAIKDPIWIKLFENHIDKFPNENIVVSDIRFPDELIAVKNRGGIILKITRPSYDNSGDESKHSSESQIDKMEYDYKIMNDGTKLDLYQKLEKVLLCQNKNDL